jgi:hypothetical protein
MKRNVTGYVAQNVVSGAINYELVRKEKINFVYGRRQ